MQCPCGGATEPAGANNGGHRLEFERCAGCGRIGSTRLYERFFVNVAHPRRGEGKRRAVRGRLLAAGKDARVRFAALPRQKRQRRPSQ